MPVPQVSAGPLSSVTTVTNPIGTKDVAGAQVNPATEDTLRLIKADTDALFVILAALLNTQFPGSLPIDLGALSRIFNQFTSNQCVPLTPTKYAVPMAAANIEYYQALPANTQKFSIHLRDFSTFRLAYVSGLVAGAVDPYETVPAGAEKYEDQLYSTLTLYFASPIAGKTAEIEAWS